MGLPKLKEYYYAAQLRPVYCWCRSEFRAKWKDIEREVNQIPIQHFIGDNKLYKELKNKMDRTTVHTLGLWFKILKVYKIQNDINILKWVAHDRNSKPALYDPGFKHWVTKGITTWCVLVKDGRLESFENIRRKYELGAHEFYRYLQMRDYFKREIGSDSPKEVNGVIQIIIKAYQESNIRIISAMFRVLNTNDKHSTKYIKTKWEK